MNLQRTVGAGLRPAPTTRKVASLAESGIYRRSASGLNVLRLSASVPCFWHAIDVQQKVSDVAVVICF